MLTCCPKGVFFGQSGGHIPTLIVGGFLILALPYEELGFNIFNSKQYCPSMMGRLKITVACPQQPLITLESCSCKMDILLSILSKDNVDQVLDLLKILGLLAKKGLYLILSSLASDCNLSEFVFTYILLQINCFYFRLMATRSFLLMLQELEFLSQLFSFQLAIPAYRQNASMFFIYFLVLECSIVVFQFNIISLEYQIHQNRQGQWLQTIFRTISSNLPANREFGLFFQILNIFSMEISISFNQISDKNIKSDWECFSHFINRPFNRPWK